MRKIKTRVLAILAVAAVATFTVCKATGAGSGGDIPGGEKVPVGWTMHASQRGGDGTATLELGFTKAVDALGIGDFTFDGATITAGALGGGGASFTLPVSNVPETGTVNVSVRKEGFDFSPVSYDWDITTGGTVAANDDNAALASLSVTYTGKAGNLVGGFTAAQDNYSFSVAAGETAAQVSATAASTKAALAITYGTESVTSGSTITLPVPDAVSKTLSVTVTAEDGVSTQTYTVTINAYIAVVDTPTGSGNDDYTLQTLSVKYSAQTENKVAGFNAANTNYSFNVDQGYETALVYAGVTSSASSPPVITYGASNADAPEDVPVVNGGAITLPDAGSKVLKIKVTAGNGNAQTYYVTINAPAAVKNLYKGTVAYSGGIKTITGVAGRDAAFVTQSAGVTGTAWTLTVPDGYIPESFVVTLSDGAYSYRSNAIYPATISTTSLITLTIYDPDDIGRQVASAQDLKDFNTGDNYALADNINLDDLPSWAGPEGFHGKFYGNGYTVKVTLKKNDGNTGLFTTLTGGALIENLVVDVSTAGGGLAMAGKSLFGGLVGTLDSAGIYTIRNVTVNGALKYLSLRNDDWLLVGALFGEVQGSGGNALDLTIEKCVSNLSVTVQAGSSGRYEGYILGVGGLIGKIDASNGTNGMVDINNCYTTGSITIRSNAGNCYAVAGGLVGNLGNTAIANLTGVTINNCYSTTSIDIHDTVSSTEQRSAGGLIGKIREVSAGAGPLTISNCIALNPTVISENASATNARANRVIGFNERTVVPPTLNTFALKGMLVGITATGTADNSAGATGDVAGEGKTAGTGTGELRKAATWTDLGFSAAVWDFTPLSTGGWPVLK
jgi:hypothetical protein